MTTQIVQKKHVHLNIFTKNQGRAYALPCPTGSFAPMDFWFRNVGIHLNIIAQEDDHDQNMFHNHDEDVVGEGE
jgi:hypothetical protein